MILPNWKVYPRADLPGAQVALAKLRRHLPLPALGEQMDAAGIAFPRMGAAAGPLPVQEYPQALMHGLGRQSDRMIPENWLAACNEHQRRSRRSRQLKHAPEAR
jgi:hypothetical protein